VILVIDNYDSFTYNLVQYMGELGADVLVRRNDQITVDEARNLRPEKIVVSPGPCTPNDAGISMEIIRELGPMTPTLGVCLGHQAIGAVFGGRVVRAGRLMHGKTSAVEHSCAGVFADLPSPLTVTRYHSLVVAPESIPDCLEVTASSTEPDGSHVVMGLRHKEFPIEGVQFHPESVLTEHGKKMVENFLRS
jgi:anthranilate synthase component II